MKSISSDEDFKKIKYKDMNMKNSFQIHNEQCLEEGGKAIFYFLN